MRKQLPLLLLIVTTFVVVLFAMQDYRAEQRTDEQIADIAARVHLLYLATLPTPTPTPCSEVVDTPTPTPTIPPQVITGVSHAASFTTATTLATWNSVDYSHLIFNGGELEVEGMTVKEPGDPCLVSMMSWTGYPADPGVVHITIKTRDERKWRAVWEEVK